MNYLMSSLVGLQDRRYQNSFNIVSASWHGFVDLGSSLQSYHWCVSPMSAIGSCSVLPVQNVGLATKKEIQVSLHVSNGLYFPQICSKYCFRVLWPCNEQLTLGYVNCYQDMR